MIRKMTLEGHFKKKGMIEMITLKSFSKLLGILGDKEKCIESDEFIYSKKTYQNFRTNARYFPFEARKETHEQHKTKIDIDEFRSGTTNITQFIYVVIVTINSSNLLYPTSYHEYIYFYQLIHLLNKFMVYLIFTELVP
jgi:hypothetical protein